MTEKLQVGAEGVVQDGRAEWPGIRIRICSFLERWLCRPCVAEIRFTRKERQRQKNNRSSGKGTRVLTTGGG